MNIADWRPHVVGVTANSPVYPLSVQIADMVKRIAPDTTVVLGGCHPTLYPTRAIKKASVDAVVVGEGEHAMTEICTALAGGKDLSGIAGIVHKSTGAVVQEAPRPFVKDLDVLPPPAFDLLPMKKYRISLGMAPHRRAISGATPSSWLDP